MTSRHVPDSDPLRWLMLLALFLMDAGCGDSTAPVTVASVTISPSSATVIVEQTIAFTANVTGSDGRTMTGRAVTWTSSNGAVASVNGGLALGVAPGTATVKATADGISGSAVITVSPKPVASVVVTPVGSSILVGGTIQLTATSSAGDGTVLTGRVATWSPSDPAIATVSTTGLVTGVAVGLTTISADIEGVVGTATIQVTPRGAVQITADPADQVYARISGDRIVWQDNRNGNSDIYSYDLGTSVESPITSDQAQQQHPRISGDRVVWQDDRDGNWDIYLYDFVTGQQSPITNHEADQSFPAISGDHIVWQDRRNGNWDIYMYDLATGAEVQITADPADQNYPVMTGGRIVWTDTRNGNQDVYMYDVVTGIESAVTNHPALQYIPSISGDRIVWMDRRDGNWDIYMYNLATGAETQITDDLQDQVEPHIEGSRIVWADGRNRPHTDIYMFDVVTGVESRITEETTLEYYPAISGNRIVWYGSTPPDLNWDIYMYELPSAPTFGHAVRSPN